MGYLKVKYSDGDDIEVVDAEETCWDFSTDFGCDPRVCSQRSDYSFKGVVFAEKYNLVDHRAEICDI